jgi:hypothetical protein
MVERRLAGQIVHNRFQAAEETGVISRLREGRETRPFLTPAWSMVKIVKALCSRVGGLRLGAGSRPSAQTARTTPCFLGQS